MKQQTNIKPGTFLSKYIELYLVFTLSALFHGISTLALPVPKEEARRDWETRFWRWFLFIFVQPFAISVEDGVIWVWQNVVIGKGGEGRGVGLANGAVGGGLNGSAKSAEKESGIFGGVDNPSYKKETTEARTVTPARWQKAVGFVWVYTFWYWIDPLTVNPLLRLGVVAGNPLPFSVVQPVLNMTGMKDYVTQLILE